MMNINVLTKNDEPYNPSTAPYPARLPGEVTPGRRSGRRVDRARAVRALDAAAERSHRGGVRLWRITASW
ncbi:MAG: hypothetical protein ACLSVD_03690 [Eggerthellaceae bacterium]